MTGLVSLLMRKFFQSVSLDPTFPPALSSNSFFASSERSRAVGWVLASLRSLALSGNRHSPDLIGHPLLSGSSCPPCPAAVSSVRFRYKKNTKEKQVSHLCEYKRNRSVRKLTHLVNTNTWVVVQSFIFLLRRCSSFFSFLLSFPRQTARGSLVCLGIHVAPSSARRPSFVRLLFCCRFSGRVYRSGAGL